MSQEERISMFLVGQLRDYLNEFYGVRKEGPLPLELFDFYTNIVAIYGAMSELLIKEHGKFRIGGEH